MTAKLRYKYAVPVASRLPDRMLRFLGRNFPIGMDLSDGWDFWLDASYAKYVRSDRPNSDSPCISCGEEMPFHECPKSLRSCGHHCDCSWIHDVCHWCGEEFGEIPPDA